MKWNFYKAKREQLIFQLKKTVNRSRKRAVANQYKGSILISVMVLLSIVILVTFMIQEEHARKSRFSVLTQQYYLTNILAEVTYSDLLSRMKDNDSNKKTGVYHYNEGNVEYSILDTTLKMIITLHNGQTFSKSYSVELKGKEVAD